jgi:hypothetical protein
VREEPAGDRGEHLACSKSKQCLGQALAQADSRMGGDLEPGAVAK